MDFQEAKQKQFVSCPLLVSANYTLQPLTNKIANEEYSIFLRIQSKNLVDVSLKGQSNEMTVDSLGSGHE